MPKFRVFVQRFPYGSVEHTPCVTWLMEFAQHVTKDPRFDVVFGKPLDDTPITMTRNRSVEIARKVGADFLLMIDSDMDPDCEIGFDPRAKEFWPTTIDFMLKHQGPCVVGAPYCGPPPLENIYVFNWQKMETSHGNNNMNGLKLGQFSREHAYIMSGIQEVAALPTGLIVFDMRGFENIEPPYFSYEYENHGPACEACGQHARGPEAHKSSTEDVVTTRDLSIAGVPQYCNWDAWAGHRKMKTVRKPDLFTADGVAAKMHEALLSRRRITDRLVDIKPPEKWKSEIATAMQAFEADKAASTLWAIEGDSDNVSAEAIRQRIADHGVQSYGDLFKPVTPATPADLLLPIVG